MTDKEFNEQKARIRKLITKWVRPIGLGWWTINFVYSREPLKSAKGDSHDCVATCEADWEYLNAQIEFNMQKLTEMSDDAVEEAFVHELGHVFVNEMRMWGTTELEAEKHDEATKHEERVVSQLANAFLWTRRRGFDEGQKTGKSRKTRRK